MPYHVEPRRFSQTCLRFDHSARSVEILIIMCQPSVSPCYSYPSLSLVDQPLPAPLLPVTLPPQKPQWAFGHRIHTPLKRSSEFVCWLRWKCWLLCAPVRFPHTPLRCEVFFFLFWTMTVFTRHQGNNASGILLLMVRVPRTYILGHYCNTPLHYIPNIDRLKAHPSFE